MPEPVVDYRLAPAFAARLLGLGLVLVAVLALFLAAVSVALDWSADVVVVAVVAGMVLVLGGAAWLRSRAYVVRLTGSGYRVRFVRGVGVAEGRWDEVREAATARPRGVACVVLTRHDGTTTTIPVALLAVDREIFAGAVRARLAATGATD